MKFNTYTIFLAIIFLLMAQGVFAFKEGEKTSSANSNKSNVSSLKKQQNTTLQLKVPSTASTAKNGGIELRIPGVGKIGTLPKLDFGLELLYGGSEDKHLEADKEYQLKGSIKKKF